MAFLKESYGDITDATLTMFSDYWEGILGKSRREMEFYQQRVVGAKDQALQTLGKAAMLVVDEDHIPDTVLREKIYQSVTREELLKAIDAFQALLLPTKHSYLDFLETRYGVIKQFSPHLLTHLSFACGYTDDDFAEGVLLANGQRLTLRV